MKTQQELAQTWRDMNRADKGSAKAWGTAVRLFIYEVLEHPAIEWAVEHDPEFELSIADGQYSAGEVRLFLEQAATVLVLNPTRMQKAFARLVDDAIEQMVNIEMKEAEDHRLYKAIVEARKEAS